MPVILPHHVTESNAPPVPFRELLREPNKFTGRTLVLGGTVVNAVNGKGGGQLEIEQHPLSCRMNPIPGKHTEGRFLVRSEKPFDLTQIGKNRRITLAGEVAGHSVRAGYDYPVLQLREFYLWAETELETSCLADPQPAG